MNTQLNEIFKIKNKYCVWHIDTTNVLSIAVCGHAYYQGISYSGSSFVRLLEKYAIADDWATAIYDFLSGVSGNWSLAVLKGASFWIASDRVRSYPVLYGKVNNKFVFSDDAETFIGSDTLFFENATEEFFWSGYPFGAKTLLDGVFQCQPGAFLHYQVNTGEIVCRSYFKYIRKFSNKDNEKQIAEKLSYLIETAIKRTADSANRKIFLPLSGGLDSRILAGSLRRAGYDNVVCFSYGIKGNKESSISKMVAESLGYEWFFIEYNSDMWRDYIFSPDMKSFLVFASNFCSMPIFSNWFAVKKLKERKIINSEDIFMPGHTGFFFGGNLPSIVFKPKKLKKEDILQLIIDKNFSLLPGIVPEKLVNIQRDNLFENYIENIVTNEAAATYLDMWNLCERQAKMIINSCRVYESFGNEWVVPFCDNDLIEYSLGIPLEFLNNKKCLYTAAVDYIFKDKCLLLSDIPLNNGLSPKGDHIENRNIVIKNFGYFYEKLKEIAFKKTYHHGHSLGLSSCFSMGKNPFSVSLAEVIKKNTVNHNIKNLETCSVKEFLNRPVGSLHSHGIMAVYAFSLLNEKIFKGRG